MHNSLKYACTILKNGGIIAYPTEGIWGLGCDPLNQTTVLNLLRIKQRSIEKGLILIAANWQQVATLIQTIDDDRWPFINEAKQTTWVFPATTAVPPWVRGKHHTIAIRICTHPIALALCQGFGQAIVSTSANLTSQATLSTSADIQQQFGDKIDYILQGKLGDAKKPSCIRDALSGAILRR